jgi:chaperonin GroES
MKMKPMGDFVLLKKHEGQETTKAGIILTSNTTNHVQADVIATGPGLFTQTGDRIPITVKIGDTVMVTNQSAKQHNQIKLEEDTYVLLRESEIVMVSTEKV